MKPFVLINLKTLRVIQFYGEVELRDAMSNFLRREIAFIALKYSEATGSYYQLETVV